MLRPGKWNLRIYGSNIDFRYVLVQEQFDLNIDPGEEKEVIVHMVPRNRNIIFNTTPVRVTNGSPAAPVNISGESEIDHPDVWFAVQIGSYPRPAEPKPTLSGDPTEIREIISHGKHKYIAGKFTTLREAITYRDAIRNQIPDAFVVAFKGMEQITVGEAIEFMRNR